MNEKLRDVIATSLGISPDEVTSETSMTTNDKWDSIGHLDLTLAVEEAFGVTIDEEKMLDLLDAASIERFLIESGAISTPTA